MGVSEVLTWRHSFLCGVRLAGEQQLRVLLKQPSQDGQAAPSPPPAPHVSWLHASLCVLPTVASVTSIAVFFHLRTTVAFQVLVAYASRSMGMLMSYLPVRCGPLFLNVN